MAWSDIKEVFYTIGSIAGVVALFRPVVEAKFSKDQSRLATILKSFDEIAVVDLHSRVENQRQVDDDDFTPFRALAYDRRENVDGARFSGPLAKRIARELDALVKAYEGLREYIQVDEWEPEAVRWDDGTETTVWRFNKHASAFVGQDGVPRNYATHLSEAAARASEMKRIYQRLQIVAELHLLEVPIAGWLLRSRFRSHGLGDA